jgi:hypothetical protein
MNAAILECREEAALADLLAAGLQPFVVQRLGATAVQVDHQRLPEIKKLLEKLGQTPGMTRD